MTPRLFRGCGLNFRIPGVMVSRFGAQTVGCSVWGRRPLPAVFKTREV